jgi:hypothetical protein
MKKIIKTIDSGPESSERSKFHQLHTKSDSAHHCLRSFTKKMKLTTRFISLFNLNRFD